MRTDANSECHSKLVVNRAQFIRAISECGLSSVCVCVYRLPVVVDDTANGYRVSVRTMQTHCKMYHSDAGPGGFMMPDGRVHGIGCGERYAFTLYHDVHSDCNVAQTANKSIQ